MDVLKTKISLPTTKTGLFFLCVAVSALLNVFIFGFSSIVEFGTQCRSIDIVQKCGLLEAVTTNVFGDILLVTVLSFGLNIIIPTLLIFVMLKFFDKNI